MTNLFLPMYGLIVLWWSSLFVFAYALLSLVPLGSSLKNYWFCYSFLVAMSGTLGDCICVANKPFRPRTAILEDFPQGWWTRVPVLNFMNLGRSIQEVWELYSFGNKNYISPHSWTWNYELPHVAGSVGYLFAFLMLCMGELRFFNIALLFFGLILVIDYATFAAELVYEVIRDKFLGGKGIHADTKWENLLMSEAALDFPYMALAGFYMVWYSYTNLRGGSFA